MYTDLFDVFSKWNGLDGVTMWSFCKIAVQMVNAIDVDLRRDDDPWYHLSV